MHPCRDKLHGQVSLDWPLSRNEKRSCALRLYEREVHTADKMLRRKDAALEAMHEELSALRHASMASTNGSESQHDIEIECAPFMHSSTEHKRRWTQPAANQVECSVQDNANPLAQGNKGRKGRKHRWTQPSVNQIECIAQHNAIPLAHDSVGREDTAKFGGTNQDTNNEVSSDVNNAMEFCPPPNDVAEVLLRETLTQFYRKRRAIDNALLKPGEYAAIAKVARQHSAERVPELWAKIAVKNNLTPPRAVHWLAKSLHPLTHVPWSSEDVPDAAHQALDKINSHMSVESNADTDSNFACHHAETLSAALQAGDLDAIRALTFFACPNVALRPRLWCSLLGLDSVALSSGRDAYREVCSTAMGDTAADNAQGSFNGGHLMGQFLSEVETDARLAWRGEAFLDSPGVAKAISNIVLLSASRHSRHIRGTYEIAALLLFALAPSDCTPDELAEAEADSFLCLTQLMEELHDDLTNHAKLVTQANRIHLLLRAYDPPLADLLKAHGLVALPGTRLGVTLLTRAGFTLADCARIWDTLLADPQRFEFCNYIVVALLLLNRNILLSRQGDAGGIAEALLSAPRHAEIDTLMCTAHAISAFERQCSAKSIFPYPQHTPLPERRVRHSWSQNLGDKFKERRSSLLGAAQSLSSLWDKVCTKGTGTGNAGPLSQR